MIFCRKHFVSQYRKIRRGILPGFKKILVSKVFMHKRGAVSQSSVVILKLRNVGKGWDSNSYLPLENPVVLPTVPWEPLEFLKNVSEIIEMFDTTETRTRTYRFKTPLSYPLCHGNHWISEECQWNHRNVWHDGDSNPDLPLQNPVVLPTVPWESLNFWRMSVKS